ncbi:MAG: DUF2298 domain-containing protein [Chloroflexi bacterium]|nr:DUF2298 domain-containing protein [Chloroflexota bacterium]
MLTQFLTWYLIVQLITLLVLPLTFGLFTNLPDRGYAFAKSLGILLVGFTLWLGTSYGWLRNETGGAWLALLLVGLVSGALGWSWLQRAWQTRQWAIPWRNVFVVEALFLLAFVAWAVVRSYDPAANHTEKPMDLMFMNSIWVSPTFPPHDAWLSGYAISYYYFGYWLLTTVGRLSAQPPEIAYNVGQACWFGLLLIGCFGIVYNLLAHAGQSFRTALFGGLLASLAVGVTGNLWSLFEWLYATGMDVTRLAQWVGIYHFPQTPLLNGDWHTNFDWWGSAWRSSRVIEDLTLTGDHLEVIDEFPIFSYTLGDNHPHVLGMPIVLLVIALAQNLFFSHFPLRALVSPQKPTEETIVAPASFLATFWQWLQRAIPLAAPGLVLIVIAAGALVFLNTWDFPPYWLLLSICFLATLVRSLPLVDGNRNRAWGHNVWLSAGLLSGLLLVGAAVLYLPYFLTAQSQAGGFIPNLFNPTHFAQFFLMFGGALLGVGALLGIAWAQLRPSREKLLSAFALVYGAPLFFLLLCALLALNTARGQELIGAMALPEGATSYLPFILGRWGKQGLTFLVLGALLALVVAWLWQYGTLRLLDNRRELVKQEQSLAFALLLAAIGLLLVYAPEFVYLRDNFGTRMNTIFKFYYQGWLLFGLSSSYAVVTAWRTFGGVRKAAETLALVSASLCFVVIAVGLVFPLGAITAKTNNFTADKRTLDATAYVAWNNPDEMAAVQWVRTHTAPDALVAEALGRSYYASDNRISTMTGRPTLHGWGGHESQWRGKAYGEMAQNRGDTLQRIYGTGSSADITQLLSQWDIDYVYVGPVERELYKMTPDAETRLKAATDLVFEQGDVRIYQRRTQ